MSRCEHRFTKTRLPVTCRKLKDAVNAILTENDERPLRQIQDLLWTRYGIKIGRNTARKARNNAEWAWGRMR